MIFNSNNKLLFLDPNADTSLHVEEKVNIILSPSLYWVKKVTLPVRSVREVSKLLPTLFEDTIPDGTYSYSAYKATSDNEFYIFAYEDKKILDTITKQNISIANIGSIHFAQSEFSSITNAMKINETQSVYIKDDILVLVPCCWIEEKGHLSLDNITLSKHKITLKQFGHIVDYKSLYGIASVMLIFILILVVEVYTTSSKAQDISDKRDAIFSKYNLKSTMFENKAILNKYNKIHKNQIKFRKYFSYILALKLKNSEKMTSFQLNKKTIAITFSGVLKNRTSYIVSALKKKGIKVSESYKNNMLHLEIEL